MKPIILLLALSTPLFARIGETREQCIQRYGQIVTEDTGAIPTVSFKKDDFIIKIIFHNGKAESIGYTKKNEDDKDSFKNQSISAEERDALLKANGLDKKWTIEHKEGYIVYRTSDNSLRSTYNEYLNIFDISISEGLRRHAKIRKEEAEKKAAEKMKGF